MKKTEWILFAVFHSSHRQSNYFDDDGDITTTIIAEETTTMERGYEITGTN
jgi:hypothetical protein